MGNRAVLAFVNDEGKKDKNSVGIYLHWNGGRDSVEGFLQTAKDYELRSGSYGVARLTQIIANGLGGTLSLGVDLLKNLDCDNYDNGVYWIDQNFNIVELLTFHCLVFQLLLYCFSNLQEFQYRCNCLVLLLGFHIHHIHI